MRGAGNGTSGVGESFIVRHLQSGGSELIPLVTPLFPMCTQLPPGHLFLDIPQVSEPNRIPLPPSHQMPGTKIWEAARLFSSIMCLDSCLLEPTSRATVGAQVSSLLPVHSHVLPWLPTSVYPPSSASDLSVTPLPAQTTLLFLSHLQPCPSMYSRHWHCTYHTVSPYLVTCPAFALLHHSSTFPTFSAVHF